MLKKDIKVGGHYTATVSGKLTTVRVDSIDEFEGFKGASGRRVRSTTSYSCTNLTTGHQVKIRSAAKFRKEVKNATGHNVMEFVENVKRPKPLDISEEAAPFAPTAKTPAKTPTTQPAKPTAATAEGASPGGSGKPTIEQVEKEFRTDPLGKLLTEALKSDPAGTDMTPSKEGGTKAPFAHTAATSQTSSQDDAGAGTAGPTASSLTTPIAAKGPLAKLVKEREAQGRPLQQVSRRDASDSKLTDEQVAVLDKATQTQVLVIEAGAGCGKTYTMLELSKILPGTGQYTTRVANLVAEAKVKFASRAWCNTIHSLAHRAKGKFYTHRLNGRRIRSSELAAMLGMRDQVIEGPDGNPKVLQAGLLAAQVKRALSNFCQSADHEITTHHVPRMPGIDTDGSKTNSEFIKQYLVPFARKLWKDKCDPKGVMPFNHDDYVKMWQLEDPYIAADYVMLDEAQDASPVMLSIMENQVKRGTRIILVGDSNQQIFTWAGAVNALAAFPEAPRLWLSQSFRFGQVIAEVANATLSHLSERTKLVLKGFDKINSRLDKLSDPTAVLCRTNAGSLQVMLEAISKDKHPCLVGKIDDILDFIKGAKSLQESGTTEHQELCCFTSWREVQAFVKTDEGQDLKLMVKVVDGFGCDKLLGALEHMPKEEDADLLISTAHKSKGREWPTVQLHSDFMPLERMDDEEVRLLYVAGTRAKDVLDVEKCPPFCGGTKSLADCSEGERLSGGGNYRTVNISKARQLSREIPECKAEIEKSQPAVEISTKEVKQEVVESQAPVPTLDDSKPDSEPMTSEMYDGRVKKPDSQGRNTYSKGSNGEWLVKGRPGQSGRITVTTKNGTTQSRTIRRMVWTDSKDVALYEVV